MFREQIRTSQALLLLLDVMSICLAYGLAVALRAFHETIPFLRDIPSAPWFAGEVINAEYAVFLVASGFGWILSLKQAGIYQPSRNGSSTRSAVIYIKAALYALLISGAAIFILKIFSISRLFFAYYFATALILLPGGHTLAVSLLRRIRRDGANRRGALLIGAGQPIAWFTQVLRGAEPAGYDLVGILLSGWPRSAASPDLPVLGSIEDLDYVLQRYSVHDVFLVGGADVMTTLAPTVQKLIERGLVVSLVSPVAAGAHGVVGRITEYSGIPMISFGPVPKDPIGSGLKRFIDVVGAGGALVVAGPVMAAVAVLIKLFDPGPVIFRQERLGMNGKKFLMYKFRSMKVDAQTLLKSDRELYLKYLANDYKVPEREDPRISTLGYILRKTSLDELPQLWNVLKGEMCLVGPRPIEPKQIEMYGAYAKMLLSVRPGITGAWQVQGRDEIRFPERAFLDLGYVGTHSIASDVSIITRTLPSIIRHVKTFRK